MTRFTDWSGYVAKTAGTSPRPLYQQAVARFDHPGTAVDLGCGAGNETLDLLQRGWSVHAVDSSKAAIRSVTERAAALPGLTSDSARGLTTELADLWAATPPAANFVYAGFSLFFVPPSEYAEAWARVVAAVAPEGRFAGHFLGPSDSWAGLPEISAHTEYAVRELFRGWRLEHFHEVDEDGKSFSGPKHWHLYEVIAAKA
jgi:trans-aconitate methyltransferase